MLCIRQKRHENSSPCRLRDVAGASVAAFGIGAIGTIVGTLAAWQAVGNQMGAEGYKVGGPSHMQVSFAMAPGDMPCICSKVSAPKCVLPKQISWRDSLNSDHVNIADVDWNGMLFGRVITTRTDHHIAVLSSCTRESPESGCRNNAQASMHESRCVVQLKHLWWKDAHHVQACADRHCVWSQPSCRIREVCCRGSKQIMLKHSLGGYCCIQSALMAVPSVWMVDDYIVTAPAGLGQAQSHAIHWGACTSSFASRALSFAEGSLRASLFQMYGMPSLHDCRQLSFVPAVIPNVKYVCHAAGKRPRRQLHRRVCQLCSSVPVSQPNRPFHGSSNGSRQRGHGSIPCLHRPYTSNQPLAL